MKLANAELVRTYVRAGFLDANDFPEHHLIYYHIVLISDSIFFHNSTTGALSDLLPFVTV
jgi:hypothetical protein